MRRFLLFALPPLAYALGIFALSSMTLSGAPNVPGLDKVVHFLLFGGLAVLSARALRGYSVRPAVAAYAGLLLASLYGISDEVHQMFTPGRSPDVRDWVADTAGAALCVAAWYAAVRVRRPAGSER